MPNYFPNVSEAGAEDEEGYKFPFLHLIIGLVLSCVAFFVLVCLWYLLISLFTSETMGFSDRIFQVMAAYLVPELIIIGGLVWLTNRSYKAGQRGMKQSYIVIAIINIIFFLLLCIVMNRVQC